MWRAPSTVPLLLVPFDLAGIVELHDLLGRHGSEWKQDALCRKYPLPHYEA